MNFKIPQDNDKYQWTAHSVMKMRQYGLSAQRVLRVVRAPHRKEEGIVKNTIAVMQPVSTRLVCSSKRGGPVSGQEGKRTWGSEIWVMYQICTTRNMKHETKNANPKLRIQKLIQNLSIGKQVVKYQMPDTKYRIISAWKYPGISPKNNPVPEEILRELEDIM